MQSFSNDIVHLCVCRDWYFASIIIKHSFVVKEVVDRIEEGMPQRNMLPPELPNNQKCCLPVPMLAPALLELRYWRMSPAPLASRILSPNVGTRWQQYPNVCLQQFPLLFAFPPFLPIAAGGAGGGAYLNRASRTEVVNVSRSSVFPLFLSIVFCNFSLSTLSKQS